MQSEIEPKPLTPKQISDQRQLFQTNSGNLCLAANRTLNPAAAALGSQDLTILAQDQFQLQPRPNRGHAVDVSALRIMQLQRSMSRNRAEAVAQLASADTALDTSEPSVVAGRAAADTLTTSMATTLHPSQQLIGQSSTASTGEADYVDGEPDQETHQEVEESVYMGGLHAAARQVPPELRVAWLQEMQQQPQTSRQAKGKSADARAAVLPARLLKCFTGKTVSDVEAQIHALGMDKHLP